MLHASRPYEYFEDAFIAWLAAAGDGYSALRSAGYDFVIVESRCTYLSPARLGDVLTIEARPQSAGRTSLVIVFDLCRGDETLASCTTVYVAVRDGRPADLPPTLRAALTNLPSPDRVDRALAGELLARLHDAQRTFYAGGDRAALQAILDPAVSWHVPGSNAIAGDYDGIDAVLGYMTRRRELAHGTLRLHPGAVLVGDDDHVASLTDGSAVIEGTEHRWSTVGLYRIRDRRIAECHLLALDQAAFDRVWTLHDATPTEATNDRT